MIILYDMHYMKGCVLSYSLRNALEFWALGNFSDVKLLHIFSPPGSLSSFAHILETPCRLFVFRMFCGGGGATIEITYYMKSKIESPTRVQRLKSLRG
jgi:hypothetical protein